MQLMLYRNVWSTKVHVHGGFSMKCVSTSRTIVFGISPSRLPPHSPLPCQLRTGVAAALIIRFSEQLGDIVLELAVIFNEQAQHSLAV
jgi:hypothetical protein